MSSTIWGRIRDAVRRLASFDRRRADERGFVAYTIGTVTSGGGTITLHLQNDTTDTSAEVEEFIISPQFTGRVNIYDSFSTAPNSGTTVTIDNLLMDEGGGIDTGNMTANENVSFTADGTHIAVATPGGGSGGNSIGSDIEGTRPIIEPGREIVVELVNETTEDGLGSVGVVFSEY